jgi:acetyl-CoA C-acetyltransferase
MLTAALDGLVSRFSLQDERLGEVAAGAVLKHSRDFNLTREAVLGSALSPTTPAYDVQQACATGLETAIAVSNKIALGQIDAGVAGGVDTTSDAPIEVNDDLRRLLLAFNRAKTPAERAKVFAGLRPQHLVPEIPRNAEPRTGLAMGDHAALTARVRRGAARSRTSWPWPATRTSPPPTSAGFFGDLVTPFLGLDRDQNLRPDTSMEKLGKLKPVFGEGEDATMTAANSTPLSDGASTVLLASEEWAQRAQPAGARPPRPTSRPPRSTTSTATRAC